MNSRPGRGHPHLRLYGTNARVLAEYVRVCGVITLPDAIRRMTSLPANIVEIPPRAQRQPFVAPKKTSLR